MGRLEGRSALVTGGASGIGRAVCLAFAREGADVAIVDFKNLDAAEAVAAECVALGRRAFAHLADVTQEEQVQAAVALTIERFGKLDICVANAGVSGDDMPLHELPMHTWRRLVDGNLTGVYLTIKAALPHMIERGHGRIITTASELAHRPAPLLAAYSAAKAGIVGLTISVAQEVAQYGIRVNTVAPGLTRTAIIERPAAQARLQQNLALQTLPRLAEPEEIAPAYVFLASDDAEFVVGQTISPSGGAIFWL
jgi:3-oxoacyl-[acyl-carrier protein] reductase